MSNPPRYETGGATMIAGGAASAARPSDAATSGAPMSGGEMGYQGQPSPDLVGSVLADRYRILKKLGEGGMGSVYLAEHTTINKRLAIKVLSSEYSHKKDLVDRFLQEARAASMIEQENVVEITDFGSTPQGSVFFVMEYLNGEDLSKTIKQEGALPWPRVKPIMVQICTALAAAHDVGIIHRDMKPENCYRIKRGGNPDFIKVLDFGIAKVQSDDSDGGARGGLTRTGMIFGTPEYMSPEQAKGERVDHRVDVYALGVILYELLTGRVPFTADTFMGILTKHMFEAPPAPTTLLPVAAIPLEVEAIILKALQKDREYRFQSMREMMAAIEAVGTGAAPVVVVHEDVMRPATGETRFSTGVPLSASMSADRYAVQRKAPPVGLFIALGVIGLAGVGGLAAWLFGGDLLSSPTDADAPVGDPIAAVGAPATDPTAEDRTVPAVEPKPSDAVPAPLKAKITVEAPGISGTVHDDRDDAKLGELNVPFELPIDEQEVGLYIRADGYQDHSASVIPDADKTLRLNLEPDTAIADVTAGKKASGKSVKKHPKTGSATKATPPTADSKSGDKTTKPPPPPPPTNSSSSSSPDLKNPFFKKGT